MSDNKDSFSISGDVGQRSQPVQEVVDKIVNTYCEELTMVIHKLRSMIKDETTELSDLEIEDILIQLPIILYDMTDSQEMVGLQNDIANQIYKEANSEAFRLARGTINDKTAVADLSTRSQQIEKIIFDRSYKIIKQKIEMAIETLNSVKKIQASRMQRYDLSRFNR